MRSFLRAALIMALIAVTAAPAYADSINVIVHPSNTQPGLTRGFLGRVFQGQIVRWSGDGQKIFIVAQKGQRTAVRKLLRHVFADPVEEERCYREVFHERGILFSSEEDVQRFVAITPNAIGIVSSLENELGVRILGVDGYMPDDQGYQYR